MTGRYALPVIAVLGMAIAVGLVIENDRSPAPIVPAAQSAEAPFPSSVAGAGLVEASTEDISIGTPVAGIVASVFVKPGVHVDAGDPLFKIDDRDLIAQLLPANARVHVAEATLMKDRDHLDRAENLSKANKDAISVEELQKRRFTTRIDEAMLASARADVERIKLLLSRYTITAPVAGLVMQVKTRVGEFAPSNIVTPPLMLLGDNTTLQIRVDVDENQAWRIKPGASAMAFVRGNPALKTSLNFERIEPFVVQKKSLTGESMERSDTRVLQVLYSFNSTALPVYAGQQVDVFIDASHDPVIKGGER